MIVKFTGHHLQSTINADGTIGTIMIPDYEYILEEKDIMLNYIKILFRFYKKEKNKQR